MASPLRFSARLSQMLLCLAITTGSAQAEVFDFIGLFHSDRIVISSENGFEEKTMTVQRGRSLEFKNEAADYVRIVIQDLNISTPPIEYGGSARITFTRTGTFEVHCGKTCPKPMKVTVVRKLR